VTLHLGITVTLGIPVTLHLFLLRFWSGDGDYGDGITLTLHLFLLRFWPALSGRRIAPKYRLNAIQKYA